MNIDTELAAIGETGVTAGEEALAASLLTVQTKKPREERAVDLRIIVSREEPDGSYVRVAATPPERETVSRDMKRATREPDQVSLRTGDRVRVEVVADQSGYIAVFNMAPRAT